MGVSLATVPVFICIVFWLTLQHKTPNLGTMHLHARLRQPALRMHAAFSLFVAVPRLGGLCCSESECTCSAQRMHADICRAVVAHLPVGFGAGWGWRVVLPGVGSCGALSGGVEGQGEDVEGGDRGEA